MKYTYSFLGGSVSEESACNAGDTGDTGFIPGWGRSPGEGNGINVLRGMDIEDVEHIYNGILLSHRKE